ncbi:MAG: hypothetical protein GF353_29920 [Candidatus Lokiarchaeota archaeon]|nr:hypothetical protein [Candidatus Lokiarchaeota archaeon]
MITTFSGESADVVWRKAANYFRNSKNKSLQSSRNGETQELLHVGFAIDDPKQRWVVSREPTINPAFALAEIVWIMNGSNEAQIINHWNPILPKFAGHVEKYHGAYGFRLRNHFGFDQLEKAYFALKKSWDSRQILLQIWDPKSDLPDINGKPVAEDIPCNICSMLKIRNNRLEWLQILRSNDLFRGLPYNFVQFTCLQEILAGWLNIQPGTYNQISDSLHIYTKDKRYFSKLNSRKVCYNYDLLGKSWEESEYLFSIIFQRMKMMAKTNLKESIFYNLAFLPHKEPAYQNLLLVIASDSARRRGWGNLANELMKKCTNPIYRLLWAGWTKRKKKKIASPFA